MAKRGKIHNIRDIFPNTNLLEGATLTQSSENDTFQVEGFTIIRAGESSNGNYYSPKTLQAAAKKKVFSGKTIRTDHPEITSPHSVKDIVGKIEKTWFSEEEQALKGSGFFSSTVKDLVTKVKEGLVGDLSINARGVTEIEKHSGDKLRRNVKEITEGFSVDLVCEAAAGGTLHEEFKRNKQLCERMKKRMDELEKLSLDELKEGRPDLVKKIAEEALKEALPEKKEEVPEETVQPVTAEEVSTLVTESITAAFKARDEAYTKQSESTNLSAGIDKAVGEVLAECGASDSVKLHVEKSLRPYAVETFTTLDSIDKTKLSEERDKILAEFDALVEERTGAKPSPGTSTPERKSRLIDLMVV